MNAKRNGLKLGDVIFWVASVGPEGKFVVPMYYLGRLSRRTDEGQRGDVHGRPVALGKGEYTATYAAGDFELEDGSPAFVE